MTIIDMGTGLPAVEKSDDVIALVAESLVARLARKGGEFAKTDTAAALSMYERAYGVLLLFCELVNGRNQLEEDDLQVDLVGLADWFVSSKGERDFF